MTRDVDNAQDILDSRDVIARIEELRGEVENYDDMPDGGQLKESEEAQAARDELKALEALAEEAEGCADWSYGETLIRDSYFEDYARQLAEDIGALENCDKWPARCIDWEQAASELQQDYTSVDFDGVTYWIRS